MKSAPEIAFDYRPSRLLAMAIAAVTVLAVVAAMFNGLDWPWRLLLAMLASALGSLVLFRHHQPGFVRIAHGASGWTLIDANGNDHPAILRAHVRRGTLLVLEFGAVARPATRIILAADNCSADLLRRLMLVLAAGEPRSLVGLQE